MAPVFSPDTLAGKVAVVTGGAEAPAGPPPWSSPEPGPMSSASTKSAELEPGAREITASGLIPGLTDIASTRHEDPHARAVEEGGKQPLGDATEDEAAAGQALTAEAPPGAPRIRPGPTTPRRRWCSRPRTRRGR